MKIYYAHCQSIYNTPQEKRDVEMLEKMGFQVINPNSKEHIDKATEMRNNGIDSSEIMKYFAALCDTCDILAFRALPDGAIPAGVGKELRVLIDSGRPVIELPSGVQRRVLNVDQTREYLREVGQR